MLTRSVLAIVVTLLLAPATSHATFPGANGKIAFVQDNDIWTMNPDGTGQVNLTSSTATESNPAWSPDGNRIAFDSDVSGQRHLYVMLADGSAVTQVTSQQPCCHYARDPAWSPDGNRLVYHRFDFGLATINVDGTADTPIYQATTPYGGEGVVDPDWSPAGSSIAFQGEGAGNCYYGIATVNPDGTGFDALSNCELFAGHRDPSWSPDADRVAFVGDEWCGGVCGGRLSTFDSTGANRVDTDVDGYQPAWSPDGTKIAFLDIFGRLNVMNPNGTGIVDLTDGTLPDWQPIPINSYPRPKGATPFRASLTTAYNQCTAPDRTHGPPLAFPSCASPQKSSAHLTVGTGDSNGLPARNEGYLRLETVVGAPGGPDDADVKLDLFMDDVFTNALADYTGEIRGRVMLRITDKDNTPHPGGPGAATTTEIPLDVVAPCAAVADPQEGSLCTVSTTADALAPGTVKESRRSVWQLGRAELYDGGPDGDAHTPSGDTLFATQGLFVP